ncbi:Kinase [Hexamita inflata]|uniref:non-specific serine/threonine protein kinase n=1 Tax=Hexamita inflata TaxID=28002 RepID=A0AA86NFS5_9EUKA|nr:Kinase [Hexamita inflata]
MLKFLGKGSYGQVKLVRRISDQQMYALKEINVSAMKPRDREDQLNEIRILASIYHPNVLAYYEAFLQDGKLNIVTEYADSGDLDAEIAAHAKSKKRFSEQQIWSILLQCLNGLKSIHQQGILHRDIKGQNILKFKNTFNESQPIYKLADFGVSKVLHSKFELAKTGIGTPYYISPEIWRNQQYNEKTDVFSMGCLIYELCTLKHPFEGKDMKDLSRNVLKGIFPPIQDMYSVDLRQLVYKMMSQDAARRPSIQQLLELPFLQKYIDNCPTSLEEEVPLGENTQLQAGIKWNQPQLLQTIQLNQNMQIAMNGANKQYEQKICNAFPQAAYQKRKEFEILQDVHQKRKKQGSQDIQSDNEVDTPPIPSQQPLTQPRQIQPIREKKDDYQIKNPVNAVDPVKYQQQQQARYHQQASYQQQMAEQYKANPPLNPYQQQYQQQQQQKNNQLPPVARQLPPVEQNVHVHEPKPVYRELSEQEKIIKEQQYQLLLLNQQYLRQQAAQRPVVYKQGANLFQNQQQQQKPADQFSMYPSHSGSNASSRSNSSNNSQSRFQRYQNYPAAKKPVVYQILSNNLQNQGYSQSRTKYANYDDQGHRKAQVVRQIE